MKPSELLNQANAVLDNGVRTKEAHDLVRVKTRDWSRSDTVTMTKER